MTDRFLKKKKRLLIFYRKLYKNVKIERILKKDFGEEKKDYLIIDEKFKKKIIIINKNCIPLTSL